jgi:ubiquinone/menaquinone biosynthesis C-methylase UbiE
VGSRHSKSMNEKIAYLGCGEYPMKGVINVDIRPLPGVDVVADVKKLPFADGELDGVASRNLIEHFDRFEIKDVLKEWVRVVKPSGFVQFETVDMGAAMDMWREIPTENLLDCFYGAQTYPENYHKMLMTMPILEELLREGGLKVVEDQHFIAREIPRVKITATKL